MCAGRSTTAGCAPSPSKWTVTVATYDDCTYTVNAGQKTIVVVFQSRVWDGSVASEQMTLTDPQDVVWELRAQ
jgi:hypothetical protein